MAPRNRSRSRSLVLSLLLVVTAACIQPKKQPVRATTPMNVAVAIVFDEEQAYASGDVPKMLTRQVTEALAERNLRPRVVSREAFAEPFTTRRTTQHRLGWLAEKAPEQDLILLLETRAVYYSHLNGRYRWTVFAKATLSAPDEREDAASREIEYAAFLDFDHERGPEALESLSPRIADAVGRLADDFLGGLQSEAAWAGTRWAQADATTDAVPAKPSEPDAVYFVLVDRFANGNPENDGKVDPHDPQAFHGGDLEGVIEHLDELHELGIRTVWLSPVFESQEEKFHGHGAYHGYWVLDLGKIEPRFGDVETLKKLSRELHQRDMRLMLDVVLNHLGWESPLAQQHTDWFHHKGGVEDWNDPAQLLTHDVHGLPDLRQEDPEVYDYLLSNSRKWIDTVGVDGFRLDAVKHVPLSFWKRYNEDIRAHAGKDFVLLGEDLDGDARGLAQTMRQGEFTAMFDFPLHFAMVDTFCGDAPPARLGTTLFADRFYDDPSRLVTLLDNHDLPRISSACHGDVDAVKNAIVFMLTARGTPSFYYGTEVGLTGREEPANRADMKFVDHPLRKHIAHWLKVRREHRVFTEGRSVILGVSDKTLTYARVTPSQAAVIVVNTSDDTVRVSLPAALRKDSSAVELVTGRPVKRARLKVPAGDVRVVLLEPETDGSYAGFARKPGKATVRFRAGRVPAGEKKGRVVVVGSDPSLGYWDPAHAVELSGGQAAVKLAAGGVYELKLARVDDDGEVTWEQGPNRSLFVPPGGLKSELQLDWR